MLSFNDLWGACMTPRGDHPGRKGRIGGGRGNGGGRESRGRYHPAPKVGPAIAFSGLRRLWNSLMRRGA